MDRKDQKRFAAAMMALGEAFDKRPSPQKVELYWQMLSDLTIEQVEAACKRLIQTRTLTGTFPLVAEIRNLAGNSDSLEEQALLAWDKFFWAFRHVGEGMSVAFDDPVITQVVLSWAGGWVRLNDLDWRLDRVEWRRREFLELYKVMAKNRDRLSPPPYLEGLYERQNLERGFVEFIPPPLIVKGETGNYWVEKLPPAPKKPELPPVGIKPDLGGELWKRSAEK